MPPRLDRQGARPPVGPTSFYWEESGKQHRASAPRRRRCLLKGCEAWFRGGHPLARYCSEACRKAARRWTQWRANRRYRRSEGGKSCRREQSRRRRKRRRQPEPGSPAGDATECEGYQEAGASKKSSCSRPGCYRCFSGTSRSPLQKFCSHVCRRALRRVLEREARWRRRLQCLAPSPPGVLSDGY